MEKGDLLGLLLVRGLVALGGRRVYGMIVGLAEVVDFRFGLFGLLF